MAESPARRPIELAVVLIAYVAAGQLALTLVTLPATSTGIWPPTGVALAAMLLVGYRVWPAVLAGAFFLSLIATGAVWPSAGMAVGNTAEALLAAWFVNRLAGGRAAFQTAQSTFRVAALTGLFSTTLSATWGVTILALFGIHVWDTFADDWMAWWLGHLTANLIVAPFVLIWATSPPKGPSFNWRQGLEAVGLVISLVIVALIVFAGLYPSDVKTYPLEFLCVPFFLWAAFRFGRREVISALQVLTAVAVWGTLHRYGPFTRETQSESLVLLQAYLCVMAVMSVALASVVADHRHAEARLLELSMTDSLTGLANYRRLLEVLRLEIARSDRTRRAFAVVFMDVNALKAINDRYGHMAGSRVLCRIADTLRRSCRTTDTPVRFGGDEFAVVLTETGKDGANQFLTRVAEELAANPETPAVTLSGGVSVYPDDGGTPSKLLSFADEALYVLKGRTLRQTGEGDREKDQLFRSGPR